MTGMKGKVAHCYRCIFTWRIRREEKPQTCPRCRSRRYGEPRTRPVRLGNGLGIEHVLLPHRREILSLAHRYGARNVRVFGSVRRREADEESDVDLLVDRGPNMKGLARMDLQGSLEAVLRRRVDIAVLGEVPWYLEPRIRHEAVPL